MFDYDVDNSISYVILTRRLLTYKTHLMNLTYPELDEEQSDD